MELHDSRVQMAFLRSLDIFYPCDGCVGPTGEWCRNQSGFIMCATLPKHVTSVERDLFLRWCRFMPIPTLWVIDTTISALTCPVMTDFNAIERWLDLWWSDGWGWSSVWTHFFHLSGTVDLTPFKHESVRDHRVRLLWSISNVPHDWPPNSNVRPDPTRTRPGCEG
jgi:hypothetical protein